MIIFYLITVKDKKGYEQKKNQQDIYPKQFIVSNSEMWGIVWEVQGVFWFAFSICYLNIILCITFEIGSH